VANHSWYKGGAERDGITKGTIFILASAAVHVVSLSARARTTKEAPATMSMPLRRIVARDEVDEERGARIWHAVRITLDCGHIETVAPSDGPRVRKLPALFRVRGRRQIRVRRRAVG
jgi:hypothetical protein